MTTLTRRLGLLVAAAAAAAAVGTHVTASAAAFTVRQEFGASAESATATSPAPDGYVRVVDDTGIVSIAIPTGWSTETAPTNDGNPNIETAPGRTPPPDCDGCTEGYQLPWISVLVSPYKPIEQVDDCESPDVTPFDNGRFVGNRIVGGGCDADIEGVEASQVDHEFNVSVSVAYSSVDLEPMIERAEASQIFETVLDSLEWTGVPYSEATAAFGRFPYLHFEDVPQLGTEPARGSGCGSEGQIGETIPDGLWAGYVPRIDRGAVHIDLLCIYSGESAEAVLAAGSATVLNDDPNYLIVNNNTRERVMGTGAGFSILGGVLAPIGWCVEGPPLDSIDIDVSDNVSMNAQAWIMIEDGLVTWVFYGCDVIGSASGELA